MQLTFFGTDTDLLSVWRWLFEIDGMHLIEEYSMPDATNRWFTAWDDFCVRFEENRFGLAAWSEPVGGRPRTEAVTFTANYQQEIGAKGRTVLNSPALIRMNRDNTQNGCWGAASLSCWSEKGARQRSVYSTKLMDEVDWKLLLSIARRVSRRVSTSAPAKMRTYPILPDAFQKLAAGQLSLWNWGEAVQYPSPLIVPQ